MFKHFTEPNSVPEQMRDRPQFVLWKFVKRTNKTTGETKVTKAPFQANGKFAKSNQPETWSKLDDLLNDELYSKYDGIGYCFAEEDGLVGIDLDKCIAEDGAVADWAKDILDQFSGTYQEKTPSGKGFHIICEGKAPTTGTRKWTDPDTGAECGFEIYDYTSPRYFTVTGAIVDGNPGIIIPCQGALSALNRKYFQASKPSPAQPVPVSKPLYESVGKQSTPELDEILAALDYVNADEYSVWLEIGMAIKSAGLPVSVWDTWSQKSPKWDAGCCDAKWKGLNPSSISVKTIFHYAVEGGFSKADYLKSKGNSADYHTGYSVKKIKSTVERPAPSGAAPAASPKADLPPVTTSSVAPVAAVRLEVERPAPAVEQEPEQISQPDLEPATEDDDENVVDIKTRKPASIFNKPNIQHPRWSKHRIPGGYDLSEVGGLAKKQKKSSPVPGDIQDEDTYPVKIAGPIYPIAILADYAGDKGGGLVIECENLKGKLVTVSIPRSRLHEDARLLAQELASRNFEIVPGKEKDLLTYLGLCDPPEEKKSVEQTGWSVDSVQDKAIYVWPEYATDSQYWYIAPRDSAEESNLFSQSKEPEDLSIIINNPYALFASLASLSSVLLRFVDNMSTGGFHFFGSSSSGKTTLLQVAASMHGCGADPGTGQSYIKRWNTTRNGLEALASIHNDAPLVMDELGSVDGRHFSSMIYDLSGGQGKSAMNANRNLKKAKSWRTVIISSGEISSQSKLEESAFGRRSQAKAGALIRLIDIEIKDQIFSGREEVDSIKYAASTRFGHLGPALIRNIASSKYSDIKNDINDLLTAAYQRILEKHPKLSSIQTRALRHFALCEVVGYFLILELKVLQKNDMIKIRRAIDLIVDNWIESSQMLSDAERSIVALRDYILKYKESRFKSLIHDDTSYFRPGKHEPIMQQISGYFDRNAFYVLPEAFSEATNGEARVAAQLLMDRGLLEKPYREGKLQTRISPEGRRILVYGVKSELLET